MDATPIKLLFVGASAPNGGPVRQLLERAARLDGGAAEAESAPDLPTALERTEQAPFHALVVELAGAGAAPVEALGRLAERHSLLREVIDATPDHIYAKDAAGRFLIANLATRQLLGIADEAALLGKTDFDLFPRELAEWFWSEELELLRSGVPTINREAELVGSNGRRRWVLTHKAPMRDASGRIIGLVGVNRDITQRKLAEQRLSEANAALERREKELLRTMFDLDSSHEALRDARLLLVQAEKMDSIGRLAAGVAHEVKNPLAVISMGLEYLVRSGALEGGARPASDAAAPQASGAGSSGASAPGGAGGDARVVLERMRNAVARADGVIRGLLDFSRPTTLSASPRDLNEIVHQALVLVQHELSDNEVELRTELGDPLPAARMDGNKIEQVLVNLMVNAAHAMPRGGSLTVRTSARVWEASDNGEPTAGSLLLGDTALPHAGAPTARLRPGQQAVVIEIDDTGGGIPPDRLARIFDPFYTTKGPGKGTGLGLTVCRTIVELHGGVILLCNRPNGGARALVALAAEPAAPPPQPTPAGSEPRLSAGLSGESEAIPPSTGASAT